jgi:hypothetical protein
LEAHLDLLVLALALVSQVMVLRVLLSFVMFVLLGSSLFFGTDK